MPPVDSNLNEETPNEVPEVSEEIEDDSAFLAGFAEAHGDEPPTPAETPKSEEPAPAPAPAAEVPTETPPAETPEEEPVVFEGLTRKQLLDAIGKANQVESIRTESENRIRQLFGKIGEVNAVIQELKASQQSARGMAFDPTKLSNLSEIFPEVAEVLAKDLAGMVSPATGGADPAEVEKLLSDLVPKVEQNVERRIELRFIRRDHADFDDVVKSQEFHFWKDNVLDKELAAKLEESWDSSFVSPRLTEFKEWKAKAAQARKDKQNRLEDAITPSGTRRIEAPPDDESAFLSGFNSVRNAA